MSLVRIRFDDVMWESGNSKFHGKELDRLKMHINWCKPLDVTLAPNVLCQDIMKFPDTIPYLNGLVEEMPDRVDIDIHGWDHGPYAPRKYEEVVQHLQFCMGWFERHIDQMPIRWVSPHGANSFAMQRAAREFGLTVETTEDPVIDQRNADTMLRQTRDPSKLDGKIIMVHWWERGMSLYRIARIMQHRDVGNAIIESKHELDASAWKACWGEGWHKL